MIKPSTKVYREQIIEGFSIPAVIHNGSYFFVDIDVYSDGRVECWNFEDFEHFKKDVNRGWVVLSIPDNEEISISELGWWKIKEASWLFTKESFINYVSGLVKELNPKLNNLYSYSQKVVNGIRIGDSGKGTPYKEKKTADHDPFPEKIRGDSTNLFYKDNEIYYLVKVIVFSDSTVTLSRLEEPVQLSLEEFEKLTAEGIIVTSIPFGSIVHIHGLGSFTVAEGEDVSDPIDIKDTLLQIKDILSELRGEPSTVDICRKAYKNYLDNPTADNKEKLRDSYESIPEHHKIYVGDMDIKDIQVRMILYGKQEIESWTHYRVAQARGEKLPSINIPGAEEDTIQ